MKDDDIKQLSEAVGHLSRIVVDSANKITNELKDIKTAIDKLIEKDKS